MWGTKEIGEFSSQKYWGLKFVLLMRRSFLCNLWGDQEAVAEGELPLPCDSSLAYNDVQRFHSNATMSLFGDAKPAFKLDACPKVSINFRISVTIPKRQKDLNSKTSPEAGNQTLHFLWLRWEIGGMVKVIYK